VFGADTLCGIFQEVERPGKPSHINAGGHDAPGYFGVNWEPGFSAFFKYKNIGGGGSRWLVFSIAALGGGITTTTTYI
jgi:hypothetical protein